jgi:hypothetical protein
MFVDMNIWRRGVLFVVFLGVLAHGSTTDQRNNGRRFCFLPIGGLLGMFWVFFFIFLWLRIPVMGVQVIFFFASSRIGDPGIEKNDKVGAFDIWVFE